MEFTFTRNNPRNTELVGPGFRYQVSSSTMGRHRTISRDAEVLGEVEFHAWTSDILRMGGKSFKVKEFMPTTSWSGRKRTFSYNGATYQWKISSGIYTLTDPNGKPIASMRTRTFHDSTLHVSQHALPMLDMLVVTLMIFWGIQDRQRRAAAASAASSAGASS